MNDRIPGLLVLKVAERRHLVVIGGCAVSDCAREMRMK